MTEVILAIFYVVLMVGAVIGAYLMGRRHGREAAEEWFERVEPVQPTTRAAGQPTNVDGPPSRINKPKWRQGMLRGGDAHNR